MKERSKDKKKKRKEVSFWTAYGKTYRVQEVLQEVAVRNALLVAAFVDQIDHQRKTVLVVWSSS